MIETIIVLILLFYGMCFNSPLTFIAAGLFAIAANISAYIEIKYN